MRASWTEVAPVTVTGCLFRVSRTFGSRLRRHGRREAAGALRKDGRRNGGVSVGSRRERDALSGRNTGKDEHEAGEYDAEEPHSRSPFCDSISRCGYRALGSMSATSSAAGLNATGASR